MSDLLSNVNGWEFYVKSYLLNSSFSVKFSQDDANDMLKALDQMRICAEKGNTEKMKFWLGFLKGVLWNKRMMTIENLLDLSDDQEVWPSELMPH